MLPRYFDRRGFSLVEALISATLVLLVLGLGANFLIPLMRMQVKGGERGELQQRASLVLDDLRSDLAATTASGVTLSQSPGELVLAIHDVDNVAADGTLVWRDELVIYQWKASDGVLRRGIWKDLPRAKLRASGPTRLDQGSLSEVAGQAAVSRITSGLSALEIGSGGWSGMSLVTLPLTVRLAFTTPSGETRKMSRVLGGRLPSL